MEGGMGKALCISAEIFRVIPSPRRRCRVRRVREVQRQTLRLAGRSPSGATRGCSDDGLGDWAPGGGLTRNISADRNAQRGLPRTAAKADGAVNCGRRGPNRCDRVVRNFDVGCSVLDVRCLFCLR